MGVNISEKKAQVVTENKKRDEDRPKEADPYIFVWDVTRPSSTSMVKTLNHLK